MSAGGEVHAPWVSQGDQFLGQYRSDTRTPSVGYINLPTDTPTEKWENPRWAFFRDITEYSYDPSSNDYRLDLGTFYFWYMQRNGVDYQYGFKDGTTVRYNSSSVSNRRLIYAPGDVVYYRGGFDRIVDQGADVYWVYSMRKRVSIDTGVNQYRAFAEYFTRG